MEIRYAKDVDPNKLNGFRDSYEAMKKAVPLAFEAAYRDAAAYGTDLVGWHNERLVYLSPKIYSLDEIRSGIWKTDPDIYHPHDSIPPVIAQ